MMMEKVSKKKIKNVIVFPNEKPGLFDCCVKQFDKNESVNEKAVKKVFSALDDTSLENILIRVIVLNDRYSTGLTNSPISDERKNEYGEKKLPIDVMQMANHIYKNKDCFTDVHETNEVVSLVNRLRNLGEEYVDAYSFATKYCSWHFENVEVPIVDSYVKGLLYYFNRKCNYAGRITQEGLKDYGEFIRVYEAFIEKCELKEKTYKEIDKYLWMYSKNLKDKKPSIDVRI